jgi:hypothetical protein
MTIRDALGLSGASALARALAGDKKQVIALDEAVARAVEQAGHVSLLTKMNDGKLLHDARADALCLSGLPGDAELLRECARAVKPGGRLFVATGMSGARRDRPLVMALLLHAGLVDLQQRWSRGIVVSSGRVRR